ncbi:hypothetical protein [Limoniibacter endophyticus]|uniref:Lambda family phage tail tape measure protein n=1 Tax=Limoniibacter endophyticus TaxID=1565040 RepID=A0A8J3GIL8_9HYPH|nr:hypothetical protein [Limoniibacter endophyticus]GHC79349.1 hypothetical protein GCM10010136_31820 [Limoniibacter endophyticus]
MDIATLGLRVDSAEVARAEKNLDQFSGAADRAEARSRRLELAAVGMRGAFAALATGLGAAFGIGAFVNAAMNAQTRLDAVAASTRKIDAALKLNGYTWDLTTRKILDFASAQEKLTGRSAQEILDLAPNLASFQFTEQVALRSIQLADDMSAAWGGNLQQNFEGLARALADPVKGFAMLSQRGIQLDADQKKLVKSLMETNRGLEAQGVVFEALESQVKGIAEAGYTPLQRAQDAARKSVEDFFQALVSSKGAGDAIIGTLNAIATISRLLTDNIGGITTALGIFAAGHIISGITSITASIFAMNGAMNLATVSARALSVAMAFLGGPIGAAVMAVAAAYLVLRNNTSEAASAAQIANQAYRTNEQALGNSTSASRTYTAALRDQIAMQVEAARTALITANAQWESAVGRRDAFRGATGMSFAPFEYSADASLKEVNALDFALGRLEDQLAKVDAGMTKAALPSRQFGSELDKVDKAAQRAAKAYQRLVQDAQQFIAQQELEARVLGMTEREANRLRYTQDLLNQAANDNIKLTPKQRQELEGLAVSMANTEDRTNRLRDAFDFAKDTTKGFMTDLRSGLEQGKGFFQSFADAALNALNKIIDKMMDLAIDNFFTSGSSGGGFLGGLLGAVGGLFGVKNDPWAGMRGMSSGGWTGNMAANQMSGHYTHGQEFVVRAGPAAQHRQMLEAMNAGRAIGANNNQPAAANQNGGSSTVEVRLSPDLEARILEQSGQQSVKIVQANEAARQVRYQNGAEFG